MSNAAVIPVFVVCARDQRVPNTSFVATDSAPRRRLFSNRRQTPLSAQTSGQCLWIARRSPNLPSRCRRNSALLAVMTGGTVHANGSAEHHHVIVQYRSDRVFPAATSQDSRGRLRRRLQPHQPGEHPMGSTGGPTGGPGEDVARGRRAARRRSRCARPCLTGSVPTSR
jgi:hypothetical protein